MKEVIKIFLQSNQGLGSRFANTIFFDDFSADECYQILKKELEKNGLQLSDEYQKIICELFDACINNRRNWGNARDVKAICKYIDQSHVNRVVNLKKIGKIITMEDVKSGFCAWEKGNISG